MLRPDVCVLSDHEAVLQSFGLGLRQQQSVLFGCLQRNGLPVAQPSVGGLSRLAFRRMMRILP